MYARLNNAHKDNVHEVEHVHKQENENLNEHLDYYMYILTGIFNPMFTRKKNTIINNVLFDQQKRQDMNMVESSHIAVKNV